MEVGTILAPCLEEMKHVRSPEGEMLTKPFLDVCKLILPILDKFGAAMSMVKSDLGGDILRLESTYYSDPSKFNLLHSLVRGEFEAKKAKGSSSCTNSLLWLTRYAESLDGLDWLQAMDFLVELFRNLVEHSDWTISQACTDSYNKTLKKWHGWLASSSFTVALKMVPDRQKFMEIIGGSGNVIEDMEKFCRSLTPLLEENHKFFSSLGVNNLKSS